MHTILLVDDEKCVLESLYRGLKKEPYDIICAESAQEALDILEAQDVSVILSDVKMPGMNGIEFLKAASDKSPYSVKMLLSGYSEVDLIVDAINTANLWRYVPKPWNNEDLIMAISNGIEYFELREERRELIIKLEKKNQELAELNNNLEEKVNQRTALINSHVNLLMQLINGIELKDFANEIVSDIKKLMKANDVSIFYKQDNGDITMDCEKQCPGFNDCKRLVEAVTDTRTFCLEGDLCAVPILNADELFAIMVIKNCDNNYEENRDNLESLLVIFKIAIQREMMKTRTSSIMGDIEKLLEGC